MEKLVLNANLRKDLGKSAKNAIRKSGRIPGIFYSRHNDPIAIDVPEGILKPLVFTSEAHLLSLNLEGMEELECVIKDVQFDPLTDRVIHFDLLGLTRGETIQLEVPIQFHGNPVGVKEGGIVQQSLHKLDIECLPKDIPQRIDIEVAHLKLGDSIHVSDLSLENITILNSADAVIIAVTHPKLEKETVEETEEEEVLEPEVISKGKSEEEKE